MDISVLIPWRTDNGPRQEALDFILPMWDELGVEVCIGEDDPDGPFNCARSQNRAFRKATGDNLVMFGADCIPTLTALSGVEAGLQRYPWFPLYGQTGYYSKDSTAKILRSEKPYQGEPFEHLVPFCTGVIALSRSAYEETGGMDERFAGWGMEDAAFRRTLYLLFGDGPASQETLACLWHEESARGNSSENNWALVREYEALTSVRDTGAYLRRRGSFL